MLKLIKTIKKLIGNGGHTLVKTDENFMCGREDFHRILGLERERSDRSGLPFSILVHELNNSSTSKDDLQLLVNYLKHRLRATDSLGWLDGKHIGITLFNTSSAGAKVLAGDIHEKFKAEYRSPLKAKVFVYPDEALKITPYSKDFRKTLKIERERSDRSGLPFSILIFALKKTAKFQNDVDLMKNFLSHRLRATDCVGWIDDDNIGITMFNTMPTGAKVLAKDIHNMFINANKKPPETKILIYQEQDLKLITYGPGNKNVEKIDFSESFAP